MDALESKSHFEMKKKGNGNEVDPLLAPKIIPRPRYELVLTGDQDRYVKIIENTSKKKLSSTL